MPEHRDVGQFAELFLAALQPQAFRGNCCPRRCVPRVSANRIVGQRDGIAVGGRRHRRDTRRDRCGSGSGAHDRIHNRQEHQCGTANANSHTNQGNTLTATVWCLFGDRAVLNQPRDGQWALALPVQPNIAYPLPPLVSQPPRIAVDRRQRGNRFPVPGYRSALALVFARETNSQKCSLASATVLVMRLWSYKPDIFASLNRLNRLTSGSPPLPPPPERAQHGNLSGVVRCFVERVRVSTSHPPIKGSCSQRGCPTRVPSTRRTVG